MRIEIMIDKEQKISQATLDASGSGANIQLRQRAFVKGSKTGLELSGLTEF